MLVFLLDPIGWIGLVMVGTFWQGTVYSPKPHKWPFLPCRAAPKRASRDHFDLPWHMPGKSTRSPPADYPHRLVGGSLSGNGGNHRLVAANQVRHQPLPAGVSLSHSQNSG